MTVALASLSYSLQAVRGLRCSDTSSKAFPQPQCWQGGCFTDLHDSNAGDILVLPALCTIGSGPECVVMQGKSAVILLLLVARAKDSKEHFG